MNFFVLKDDGGVPAIETCNAKTAAQAIEAVCGIERVGFLAAFVQDFGKLFPVEGFEKEGDFANE